MLERARPLYKGHGSLVGKLGFSRVNYHGTHMPVDATAAASDSMFVL